ncbi:MAG: hypothetical protein LBQ18_05935 [Campylobacteraceae bacterium]|jgi:hypothetical protein|nr:hypothetical protein [Campylobacteraceae bacterium]
MDKDMENVAQMGEIESPFTVTEVENEQDETPQTRTELEQMTAKQLAVIAAQYVNASQETIVKWAKKDIISVILNKGMDKKSSPRQSATKSDSRMLIETLISFLDGVKIQREQKPLYKPAKEIFSNNAINIVDEKFQDGTLSAHGTSRILAVSVGLFLIVDAFIGAKNIPAFYTKIKEKFKSGTAKKAE